MEGEMAGALGKLSHCGGSQEGTNRKNKQEVELIYKTLSPTHNDPLPSTKLHLLMVLQLSKAVSPSEDQVLRYPS